MAEGRGWLPARRGVMTAGGAYSPSPQSCALPVAVVVLYGDGESTRRWRPILYTKIIRQQAYFDRHGIFPADQRPFVESFLSERKLVAAE